MHATGGCSRLRAHATRRLTAAPRCPAQRRCASARATPVDQLPNASFGIFICSGSPAVAEAVNQAGVDWVCLDAQHSPLSYDGLAGLLRAVQGKNTKTIVRVGGPHDRFCMQQALDLGADGVMIPLVDTRADAEMAVSACLYPPAGVRSVAYPIRGAYKLGSDLAALTQYLRSANEQLVEVWVQVETRACLDNLDSVLSVPGITCAFLGPVDMMFSTGLIHKYGYNLVEGMASPELAEVFSRVLKACSDHGVQPGVFCLGQARAATLAANGWRHVAYDVDLNILTNYGAATMQALRPRPLQA